MSPGALTTGDASGLRSITYEGCGERRMFDRRVDDWVTVEACLSTARLAAVNVEFQVNPSSAARLRRGPRSTSTRRR